MNQGWEYGSIRKAPAESPFFVECNRSGQVLWMSDDARSMLGAVVNPGISIPVGTPSGTAGPSRRPSAGYFFPLLERGDRVLIGVQLTEPGEDVADREATGLLVIQGNLLRHCFQLQHMERNLSARAGLKRRGGGRQSLFQVERERQRLGRELHTGVGQMLAAIQLQVEIIGAQFGDPPAPVKQALGRISTLAIEALEQVRSVSKRLHPPEWQRLTLDAALEQLWEISGIPLRFQASLRIDPLPHEPALEVKVLMYRAAQEAISNMARHSRATRIDMTLRLTGERLVLTIQDNGVGFQVSAPASLASGIGLRSIREQAASLGGKLTVESSRLGTKLEVSAPFFRDDFVNPPFQKE